MRWTRPKLADIRTIRRFLWLPLTINRETRWLEFAPIVQKYCFDKSIMDLAWRDVQWADRPQEYETIWRT